MQTTFFLSATKRIVVISDSVVCDNVEIVEIINETDNIRHDIWPRFRLSTETIIATSISFIFECWHTKRLYPFKLRKNNMLTPRMTPKLKIIIITLARSAKCYSVPNIVGYRRYILEVKYIISKRVPFIVRSAINCRRSSRCDGSSTFQQLDEQCTLVSRSIAHRDKASFRIICSPISHDFHKFPYFLYEIIYMLSFQTAKHLLRFQVKKPC